MGAIAAAERADPALAGLSTTITLLLAHRNFGDIGHRGDSRAYLIRAGRSHQLTRDHELTDPLSNEESLPSEFDVFLVELQTGDAVVLCTDGAEAVMEHEPIARAAEATSPKQLASQIVRAARARDPTLDATAVVVRVRAESEAGWLELSCPPESTGYGHTLARA